jgi:hypothetical protein
MIATAKLPGPADFSPPAHRHPEDDQGGHGRAERMGSTTRQAVTSADPAQPMA